MSLKQMAKDKIKRKVKKVVFHAIKPFLPFILIIVGLFFAVCTIIDAVFIQEVQSDSSSMSPEQLEIKNSCIEMAEYLNTCNNFVGGQSTNYLLDVDNREANKQIEWSHLYSLMAFHNMTNNRELDKELLNEIASNFESTFIYEKDIIKIETKTIDDEGNETIQVSEQIQYLLIESDSIMGHFKYHYEKKTFEKDNTKTTKKIFTNEELIGERYERLKDYLKKEFNIKDDEIDTDLQIILQAANGYYDGEENTAWLQQDGSNIIIDGKGLVPLRNVYLANTWIYKYNFTLRYENTSYYSEFINYIVVLMYGAPVGANFVAMADGKVITAVYSNSYGNMVMIDHGSGIVTLYAHGSEILVKTNQVVEKGQPVLKVGSTRIFNRATCSF